MRGTRLIVAGTAALVVLTIIFVAARFNGNGGWTPTLGDLQLDNVELGQNGETYVVPPGLFNGQVKDLVLNEGLASLALTFKADSKVAGREVILIDRDNNTEQPTKLDADGRALFLLNLTLDGQAYRFNPYSLKVKDKSRDFELLAFRVNGPGDVTHTPNTPSEFGVNDASRPHTIGAEIDPVFVDAVARFCGFTVAEIAKVRLEPNDRERHQVAWTGSGFVEARSTIAVGQPVWVMISNKGDRCYVNPPCGNPEVPQGKLPTPAPGEIPSVTPTPGSEVPPTSTPTSVSPTSPSATNTPPCGNCSTPVPPTATPPTPRPQPTHTAQATFTPPPSGCPSQPACPASGFHFPAVEPTVGQSNPQPEVTLGVPPQEVPTGSAPPATEVVRP